MKNASLSIAIAIFFCFATQTIASAQKTATWKGGAPGRSSDWTCASNWKEGKVPNEFSDVLIPDVSTTNACLPVIRKQVNGINSLTILPGATLSIESSGALEIYEALEIFAGHAIQNKGRLDAPLSQSEMIKSREAVLAVNHY